VKGAEKRALLQLRVFINKCIETIQLFISLKPNFTSLIHYLAPPSLKELSELEFSDLLSPSTTPLIQSILKCSIYADQATLNNTADISELVRKRLNETQIMPEKH
jgi:hypothetical protein